MRGPRIDHYDRMAELSDGDWIVQQQWGEMRSAFQMATRDAAALGYRQALRDVLAAFNAHSNVGNWIDRDVLVRMLAAERGIDLSDGAS